MIRRALAGLFATVLLVLAPSAALALPYDDDDYDVAVSDTNPAVCEPFTVTVNAPAGTTVTLLITSDDADDDDITIAPSATQNVVGDSVAFEVTLCAAGTYEIVAVDADGKVRDTIQIVVGDGGAGTPAPTAPGAGAGGGAAGPGLPETGATATPLLIGGGLLLLVGGAALFFARRGKMSA